MFDRLAEIEQRYMDLADQVNDPDIIANAGYHEGNLFEAA